MREDDSLQEVIHEEMVRPEWIDYNGHMNVAYFVLAFDLAIDRFWARLGVDEAYRWRTGCSTFAVESHITYQRELKEGDRMRISMQLLGYDDKRIHHFYRMHHATQGYLAATAEWLNLHVNLDGPAVVPMPETALRKLAALFAQQRTLPWPEQAGRPIRRPRHSAWPQER